MSPRGALLTAASAAGLLLARGLDGLGVLPGVDESEAVRRTALDPRWTAVGLVACLGLGQLASRLLRRSPWPAIGVLVLGQLAVVVALEEVARELSGGPEGGGESGLWVATAAQLVLALLAVTTALLVLRLDSTPQSAPLRLLDASRRLPPYGLVLVRDAGGPPRGRAPPAGC
jgi:hypothetical protein